MKHKTTKQRNKLKKARAALSKQYGGLGIARDALALYVTHRNNKKVY